MGATLIRVERMGNLSRHPGRGEAESRDPGFVLVDGWIPDTSLCQPNLLVRGKSGSGMTRWG